MSMRIDVKKEELIATLRKNRDQHVGDYQEAMRGWRDHVATKLDEVAQKARDGKLLKYPYLSLHEPQTYQKDYDCAIAMLSMHTADIIELSTTDFQHFVQDDWDWKDTFTASNSAYTGRRH